MMDLLFFWYICGWIGLCIYCSFFGQLTLWELIGNFIGGPLALMVHAMGWLSCNGSDVIIWRRK
jgi:hypothetical protein